MKVLIIGAGTGGLALAHYLKRGSIDVAVFERDAVPHADTGGYRVGISPSGSRALKTCVSPELFDLFVATCARAPRNITMMTEQFAALLSFDVEGAAADPADGEKSVIRKTLRRILLLGLDEEVSFGKIFEGYESNTDGTVTAHFSDGSTVIGDILVGADGTNSPVRRQRLPEARLEETGMVSFGGKIPMTSETRTLLTRPMLQGMSIIMAPRGIGGIVHALEFEQRREDTQFAARWPTFVDALDDDSIGWGLWGAAQNVPRNASRMNGEQLRDLSLELTRDWHPQMREIIRRTDPSTMLYVNVRTSAPVLPWASSNVTLLGDAIHTMTPGRGAGANTALRDAALLGRYLVEASTGLRPLLEAIHDYEAEMLRYSTETVAESKAQMNASDMIHKPIIGAVQLAVMRVAMRTINAIPPLKRHIYEKMMRVRGAN